MFGIKKLLYLLMKKIVILLVFVTSYTSTYSQVFMAGVNGSYNTTWLFNKFENTSVLDRQSILTFGYSAGLDIKFYFGNQSYYSNSNFGIALNPSYQVINQKYKGNINDTTAQKSYPYNSEYNLSSFEIPLLFNVKGEAGLYAEIGLSYGLIQKAETSFFSDFSTDSDFSKTDIKSSFLNHNISGIFGFGIASQIGALTLTTGLRFSYGLIDINSAESKDAGANPVRTGTGGFLLGLAYRFDSFHSNR
jgi:hypothetical protein